MRRAIALAGLLLLPALGWTSPRVSPRVTIVVHGKGRTMNHADAVDLLNALIVGLGVVTAPTREEWIRACEARQE